MKASAILERCSEANSPFVVFAIGLCQAVESLLGEAVDVASVRGYLQDRERLAALLVDSDDAAFNERGSELEKHDADHYERVVCQAVAILRQNMP